MEKLLWEIIENSKQNKAYINSEAQFENLKNILSGYDQETNITLTKEFHKLWEKLRLSEEFEMLLEEEGGIVSDDWNYEQFYMDFGSWVIVQGQVLYSTFWIQGHRAVLTYIDENGIIEDDYMFESMMYCFNEE